MIHPTRTPHKRKVKAQMKARPSSWLSSVMTGTSSMPALPAEPQTYGDLRRLVEASPEGDWPSRVNPGMTHSQALKVLRDGLATHPDDLRLDDTRRGYLYKRNVLKECQTRGDDLDV